MRSYRSSHNHLLVKGNKHLADYQNIMLVVHKARFFLMLFRLDPTPSFRWEISYCSTRPNHECKMQFRHAQDKRETVYTWPHSVYCPQAPKSPIQTARMYVITRQEDANISVVILVPSACTAALLWRISLLMSEVC